MRELLQRSATADASPRHRPTGAGPAAHLRVTPTSIPRRCRSVHLPCGSARTSGNKGLITPRGRFVPDGGISPAGHFENADSWADPAGVLLVFEVTSTNPHEDRQAKRHGYAAAGIPCYLPVDRSAGKVTLFSDPEGEGCTALTRVDFGKTIDLPAPFSFTLDTAPLR
ncbi:Uma2 family endonuclease [Kitasatospora sp. NPDC048239]|uniref:Uma2 family endonuclease n=1 Tax=Kitasatospora sp. NPDC048239 TaxID=3364046 RepID=UPI00371CF830